MFRVSHVLSAELVRRAAIVVVSGVVIRVASLRLRPKTDQGGAVGPCERALERGSVGGEVSADVANAGCDGRWDRLLGEGVSGVEPGLFECCLDAGFDLVGDVAVDLGDAVVETVAESACLGDFWDADGDEPGFIGCA
jgi:hypothetical protein